MRRRSPGPGPLRVPALRVGGVAVAALLAGVPLLALGGACRPAPTRDDSPPPAIDAVFAEMDSLETPGCTAAASRDGATLFEGAWGMANLELGVPLEPGSVFYAGSVSKQFTNAAVALLALRGQLDLDDPIVEWFPDLQYKQPITVRDLIHHTSGIRDYFELMRLAGWPDRAYVSNAISLELLTHQRDLNFEPGTEYLYSNSGYMLLAELVPRVDGRTLREFAAEEIFEPLEMANSRFEDDYRTIVPGRASSYRQRDDGTWFRYLKAFDGVGSGGMLTTASDLLRWNENFHDPVVGGSELVDLMLTPGVLAGGEQLDYAFGLDLGEYRGTPTVGHGGSLKGFRTALTRFPEQHFSVAVLCNFAGADPGEYALRIADHYLAGQLGPAPENDAPGGNEDDDGTAPADPDAADPTGPTDAEPEGDAWEPDAAELAAFAGEYESDELQVTYRITTTSPGLTLWVEAEDVGALVPVRPDVLESEMGALRFERDASGAVTGFRLDAGRVKDVAFRRR